LAGVPDFLPAGISSFVLPSDRVINLCPHDPQAAIARFVMQLGDRMKVAVAAWAILPDVALSMVVKAAALNPQSWLEFVITRHVGAVLCRDVSDWENPPEEWKPYFKVLAQRGAQYWLNRQTLALCMAEDYRVAMQPGGIPNLQTLEWDIAKPSIARMAQQALINALTNESNS
jgi:hypothetical protein